MTGASVAMMTTNTSGGIRVVKIIQIFDYLGFIDIEKPKNLDSILQMFNSNFLDLMPNFFFKEEYDDDYDEIPTLEN